jgi:hypothetical protein
MNRFVLVAIAILACAHVAPALAQDAANWPQVKCERYKASWTDALKRRGAEGLSPEFVERHEAFLKGGCTGRADVCPRTPRDFDMANVLTILAMNFGTASTFLPFGCPT